jgi:hypothetical protein
MGSFLPFGKSSTAGFKVKSRFATDLYDRSRDIRLQAVRPYRNTEDGLQRGMKLLTGLHVPETRLWNLSNRSEPLAFELHYSDDTELMQARIATKSDEKFDLVHRQVQAFYEDSDTREIDPAFLDIKSGQHVAGDVLQLRQRDAINRLRPIKNFRVDPEYFELGPIRSLAREMVGTAHYANCDILVQTVIKPAISTAKWDRQNWWYGIDDTINAVEGNGDGSSMDWGEVGRSIAEPITQIGMSAEERRRENRRLERELERERERTGASRFTKTIEDTGQQSPIAKILRKQEGMRGFHLCVRILSVSDDPDAAIQRVEDTAGMFRNFYDSRFKQGFEQVGISNRGLRDVLRQAAGREYTDRKMTFPVDSLTGVAKVPTDLELQQYDYSMSASGMGVPPRTPRFDWDAVGLDRATADRADRQRAILAVTDPSHPIYYGTGMKNGIEAGVEPETLNVHQFVGGSTGTGKTTLLIILFYQLMQRGHGGLFFDPKGDGDAHDVVRLLPEHRKDDLVFIDIGADAEYEVGFNFLELPIENPDPESHAFDSAVSALADDFEALLAQSGGGGDWGSRMSGITRAVVRGLAEYQVRSDKTVTMLDMAFLLADEEGRQRIHEMMAEERIEWIQQATHVIADYSQDDLEPLFRRLWEWIFSSTVRSIASHPSTTISIDDIVREGKIVVVQNSSSGDTVKRLIATALIRRIWVAIERQTKRDDQPDPPEFYAVLDEFDKIVNEHSNIHDILSQARAFGLSLTFAAQNLNAGGKDDNKGIPKGIQKSIRGNCKTFLTFDPGDHKDAKDIAWQHSKNIDSEDITELSKHRIYMRTHDDQGDKTDSYKVGTFPPAPEVLDDVRSETETDALIHASQERYGQPKRTDKEIKDALLVGDRVGSDVAAADAAHPQELDMDDERVRNRALKAIYDESIRQGDPGGWVTVEECFARVRRYLPEGESLNSTVQVWREVFQKLPDAFYAHREQEDDDGNDVTEVKALDTSFMNIGTKENDGNKEHWEQMADAYVPFMHLGFIFDIPAQTGGAMPDGLAKLDEALYLDDLDGDDHARIADRINNYREDNAILDRLAGVKDAFIESEHTTGETQPSQTIKNLTQAHNEGHRCLFVCRPENAEHIDWVLRGEQPCCQDDHDEEGERRFYTLTKDLMIDGQKMTRPGSRENRWIYDQQTGQYILRDDAGTEHARFNTAAEIFTDAGAYPAGGERTIKSPIIPEYEFDGGDVSAVEWDIITVPKPERTELDNGETEKELLSPADLELYRPDESNISLARLIVDLMNDADSTIDSTPRQNDAATADARATDGGANPDGDDIDDAAPDDDLSDKAADYFR